MWRPKDWGIKNPYYKSHDFGDGEVSWNEYPEFQTYEEGADAMLKTLRECGFHDEFYTSDNNEVCCKSGMSLYIPAKTPIKGTIVFIPDEES